MDGILCLVRHTCTALPRGICYGRTDTDVADTFESECSAVREKLSGLHFDFIYSSPLMRCTKLADALGYNIICDKRLKEFDFGRWEGIEWDSLYLTTEGKEWFADYIRKECPEGESFIGLIARVSAFLKDICTKPGNKLVITHAGVIRAILVGLGMATTENAFDIKIPYGGVVKIERSNYQVF